MANSQTDYYARLGLTMATKLLRDDVIQEIETWQGLAPTLVIGGSLPIAPAYAVGLEASLTTSGHHSEEGTLETDLGTLRTGSVLLNLSGPIWGRFEWRGGTGLIRYWPAEKEGMFAQGGTTRFLAGGGLDYRPHLSEAWNLMVSLRYDFHHFTTDELREREFAGTQGVQRVSASIGLARARK